MAPKVTAMRMLRDTSASGGQAVVAMGGRARERD
jgi:hypothetical protein